MAFSDTEEAWNFWVTYGGRMGFDVRKKYHNKNQVTQKTTSARFVCSKQGFRGKDKRDNLTKHPRAETRIGCNVRMGLTLNRVNEKYEISDLEVMHNHILQTPETSHLMPSQRKITEVQAFEIELADDTSIQPRIAHELAARHVGGSSNLGYTCLDQQNYLRTKRQKELKYGEAGRLLNYFKNKAIDNPSFHYAVKLDSEEQITNIFWAEMIIDYAHFGDVVTFDTTFGTNKESWPFGVFVGFNHFRETVVFGAALMYDETCDSFCWLFDAFLSCHNHKHPQTIYTDQDVAMGKAITEVFTETRHGLCTFHIMQNANKHINRQKTSDGSNVLADFSACMCEHEDVEKFEEVFADMRTKVRKGTWLDSVYKLKEKWAECFMKNAYTLGMRSTQLSEGLNSDLKEYLNCELNIVRFFHHFDRVVQGKRDKEIKSDLASQAADFEECFAFVDNALETLGQQVEQMVEVNTNIQSNLETEFEIPENVSQAIGLKKKETRCSTSKRKKNWVDKLHKKRKKSLRYAKNGNEVAHPEPLEEDILENSTKESHQDFEFLGSYTQLLAGDSDGYELYSEGFHQ
ncbi:hypothetical protein OsI_37524 [Oryza sativa Indica Group]|uniref:Uncharacterized protein n=1 Tax=Oryza sativa subsp. indica TaxID=39946 RepID=B8BN93_ORYSI|nr:hypothetical protein OsI_37524 [Oryza sativa Indica Group]